MSVVNIAVDPVLAEVDLLARRLACPDCKRPLAPWGFARERQVRTLDGVRTLRPRRACCHACDATHVILPAWSVPRRRDSAEVIGEALLAKAHGAGHRKIAAQMGRAPGTVRGWLRAFSRRSEALTSSAQRWTRAIDARFAYQPLGSGPPFTDAVEALAHLARVCRISLRMHGEPWQIAVVLTGGLLHGSPRQPDRHPP